MDFIVKLGFTFLSITCLSTLVVGQDACVKKSPCSCVFPNGTGVDLTPSDKSGFLSTQSYSGTAGKEFSLATYFFHPCYDVLPVVNATNPGDTCNYAMSLYRYVYTLSFDNTTSMYKPDPGACNYLGKVDNSTFSSNGASIIYGNLPSQTTVLLVCADTDDKLHVSSLAEPKEIVLSFYSRNACLKKLETPDEGRSFGSTLLIVFFSLVIFYLVLGICTKKFLMGATGIEVVPNLGFWTDLPNLVKDGWAFMTAGFKLPVRGAGPAMSPDPNSYDSI